VAERPKRRPGTATSNFGVGRRENHDSSGFYERFPMPELSTDEHVSPHKAIDEIFVGNATDMHHLADDSVALVVTSPPYFAGKAYEEALGEGHIPANYVEYLQMLEDVFAECVRTLEPGGRIAVNVANLGRKPYRSLSADVIRILQDRLRLLMRGEILWVKGKGAAGSCAWGSFQRPTNPVLRDLTERVIIASKGRLDRAHTQRQRGVLGLPSEASSFRDEFMEATTDIWEIAPERATRVGHPAPFPVELPERLIHLYTYRGDLVLDPFMGSGTTAVAAVATDRHYAGYDMEPAFVAAATQRVEDERRRLATLAAAGTAEPRVVLPASSLGTDAGPEDVSTRARREGWTAGDLAKALLEEAGFRITAKRVTLREGVDLPFGVRDAAGNTWHVDVPGGFTTTRPGLKRADTMWKEIGKAAVLHHAHPDVPFLLLTPEAPPAGTAAANALEAVVGPDRPIRDVIVITSPDDLARLRAHARESQEPGKPERERSRPSALARPSGRGRHP
jgi:site-specific DNA-methyltransferase (adenine-specific)